MRLIALALALTETAGAAVAERALPLFLGVGIVSTVLFSGNGLSAHDVVRLCDAEPWTRAGLWLVWLVATTPLARDLYGAPDALFLRSMPVARSWFYTVTALHMAFLQLPWLVLWGAGGGAARGATAALLSVAAQSLLAVGARGGSWAVAAGLAAVMVVGPWGGKAIEGQGLVALLLAAFSLRMAWLRAPERPPSPLRLVRGPAPVALLASYGALLLRSEFSLLLRGLLVVGVGGIFAGVGAGNNDARSPEALSSLVLMVASLFLPVAVAGLVGPLIEAQRRMTWILDTTATRPLVRVVALRAALGGWGFACGALFGAAAGAASGAQSGATARASLATAALGAAVGLASASAVRVSGRRGRMDGGRFASAMVAVAAVALATTAVMAELAIAALSAIALADLARVSRSTWPQTALRSTTMPPVLEVRALRKRFGGRVVLDGLDLSLEGPGALVVRGANGAGKSTLIKILAGVIERDSGEVFHCGHSLDDRPRSLASVGYVPDAGELPGHLITRELLTLYAVLKGAPEPTGTQIEDLGVRGLLDERLSALSLGQRRRVGLLSALIGDPALLLLDEPTNGLDVGGLDVLVATLRSRVEAGKSALIATHDRAFSEAISAAVFDLPHGR